MILIHARLSIGKAAGGNDDELTPCGLWVGIAGCLFVVVAVALMVFGFSPGSRRYPNPRGSAFVRMGQPPSQLAACQPHSSCRGDPSVHFHPAALLRRHLICTEREPADLSELVDLGLGDMVRSLQALLRPGSGGCLPPPKGTRARRV
jgi:hypothetical protein